MSVSGSLGISLTEESLQVKVLWGNDGKKQKKSNLSRRVGVGTWATWEEEFCLPEQHLKCGRGIPARRIIGHPQGVKAVMQLCSGLPPCPALPRAPHTWAGFFRLIMNHSNTFYCWSGVIKESGLPYMSTLYPEDAWCEFMSVAFLLTASYPFRVNL